jgi:hypothetical protein
MYLFGDRDPKVAALLQERGFRRLVDALFAAESLAPPAAPPPVWETALRLGLLASDGDCYQAGRKLVLVPALAERGLVDLLRPALASYVDVTKEVGAELRAGYGQTAAAERFTWSQVSHSLLAGLFLDLAMGREVLRAGISRQTVGDTVIWAFQGVSADNAFGVVAVPAGPPADTRRALFAELWHHRARRTGPRMNPSLAAILLRIARGEPAGGEPKELLYLKHLKLVRTVGSALQLQVPAFRAADTERLLGPLTEGARRLVAEAIVPALEILEARHPWWREKIRHESYRHAAIRLILEYGVDHVISAGVCDPFLAASEVPVDWGRWLWEEPEGPRTVIPHREASPS